MIAAIRITIVAMLIIKNWCFFVFLMRRKSAVAISIKQIAVLNFIVGKPVITAFRFSLLVNQPVITSIPVIILSIETAFI